MTQGWGENGQCMMKMNCNTGAISVVMTNRNPDMEQSESGVEWLVNRNLGSEKHGSFPNNMKYSDGTYANADWMMKKL